MAASKLNVAGFALELRIHGRRLKSQTSGLQLTATVNRVGAYDLQTVIQSDERADAVIEMLLTEASRMSLKRNEQLTDLDSNEVWQVTKQRYDHPPFTMKYEVRQVVRGIDA